MKNEEQNLNALQNLALQQTAFSGSAYLIKLGHHIDSGYLEQLGTNEKAIEKIVIDAATKNDLPGVKEIIEVELVDLFQLVVNYKYKDWSGEIENGQLFLKKFSLVS